MSSAAIRVVWDPRVCSLLADAAKAPFLGVELRGAAVGLAGCSGEQLAHIDPNRLLKSRAGDGIVVLEPTQELLDLAVAVQALEKRSGV